MSESTSQIKNEMEMKAHKYNILKIKIPPLEKVFSDIFFLSIGLQEIEQSIRKKMHFFVTTCSTVFRECIYK